MPELGEWTFTTLQDAGVVLPPAAPLHLLPLMRPAKQAKAPLERLPGGAPAPDRLAFETESETSGKTAWLSSVHLFPAAFPRSHFTSTCRPGPAQPEPNAELLTADRARERELRNTDMQTADEQLTMSPIESFFPPLDEAEAYRTAKTLVDSEQPQLWSCIQRIVPSRQKNDGQRGKGVTLFLAHANGFHKEIWEPMLHSLVRAYESKGGQYIEEIWSLDTFNSGDAGVLNRRHLSVAHSWFDHARDMLQFLDYYMPALSSTKPPVELPLLSRMTGRKGRTVVGLGHSHSGACMTMINMTTPGLLAGQITVDPMVQSFEYLRWQPMPKENHLCRGAVARRDVFKSRTAAAAYMDSKPYFQAWDPRVRALHVRFGFAPLPGHESSDDPPVTLSMSKWSEAYQFSQSFLGLYGAVTLTTDRRSTSWAHLMFTSYFRGVGFPLMSKTREDLIAAFAQSGPRLTVDDLDANHLVVLEDPDGTGVKIAEALHQRVAAFEISDSAEAGTVQKGRL